MRRTRLVTTMLVAATGFLGVAVASGTTVDPAPVFINEVHYDNTGADLGETIEIAGPAGTSLTGWSLVLYNGTGGGVYATTPLVGVISDQAGGLGTVATTYPANGLQNGAPDGVALVDPTGSVQQFLSYEGTFTAVGGPADGLPSTDIGVSETGTEPAGMSLQLTGTGRVYQDFRWAPPAPSTFDAPGASQTFAPTGADTAPTVATTTPTINATGVATDASIALTFNEAVDPIGDWTELVCTSSGTVATSIAGGPETFTIDPVNAFAPGESCTLTVIAANVADRDSIDPPDAMAANQTVSFTVAAPACFASDTAIGAVQGSGNTAAISGPVTVQGVVVADEEGPAPRLRGFYLQDVGDGDATTSDAIFVFNGNANSVTLGETVQVRGLAGEFQDQTQLSGALSIERCTEPVAVTPQPVELPLTAPVAGVAYLERFEGMLVRLPQTLTVTEHFQLGRFGQVVVSSGGRLPQPTQIATPGPAAQAVQATNNLNRLIVDDPFQNQNPDPVLFGRLGNPLTAANTLRGGDTMTDVTGVLTYTWAGNAASGNAFRLRTVGTLTDSGPADVPTFSPVNPRPDAPPAVGGSLRIASFNVLNYFLTLDDGTLRCGPAGFAQECRGAETATEFARQRDKLLSALLKLDADVVGLVELENSPGVDPLADIVTGLNGRLGAERYAAIDTGLVGTDTIRVGFLYDRTAVAPIGSFATLNATIDPRFDDTRNRPALAQTFRDLASGGRLTAVVTHLKSKGASELGNAGSVCLDTDPANDVADCDKGDGQGFWNASRTAAARAVVDWLHTDPTVSGDSDVVILGDLNAYAKEDPVTVLRDAGYVPLTETDPATGGYSFAFDGQWGSLDHALASPSLARQVTGSGEYHINADEPSVLDYNTNFKSAGQLVTLYAPDEFRTADHDPLLIGATATAPYPLRRLFPPAGPPPAVTRWRAGTPLPVTFSLTGFRGLDIFPPGSPRWEEVSCTSHAPIGVTEPALLVRGTRLNYVRGLDQYAMLVTTRRTWVGRCIALTLELNDTTITRSVVSFV